VSEPYTTIVDHVADKLPEGMVARFDAALLDLAEVISDWAGEARLAAIVARSEEGSFFTAEYARGYAKAYEELAEAIRRAVIAKQEERA